MNDTPLPACEQLKLTTFNCKNIRTCGPVFNEFAKTEDIILIQEHWLFKYQLDLLNELNESYSVSAKAVDQYDPIPPVQIPRGYGGVAIFWKTELEHLVNDLDSGNQRIKCIELLTEKPTLIVNVYMPCNGEKDNYYSFVECIEQLQELINTFQRTHEILIGGDFNENAVNKTNSKRSTSFHQFIKDNDLMTRITEHTFTHPNGKDTSTIDFFLYKQKLDQRVLRIERCENLSENVSDHYPVSMTVNLKYDKIKIKTIFTSNQTTRVDWKKIDKEQYASNVAEKIRTEVIVMETENLDNVIHKLNSIMTEGAKECNPERRKRRKKPKLKVMTPEIHSAIHKKKKAFHMWKLNGRPNDIDNFFLLEKKLKTMELRRQIRTEVAKRRQQEKTTIINTRQSDNAMFHRLIRKQRGQCHKYIDELYVGQNKYTGDNVLSGWHEHFRDLATKKDNNSFDLEFLSRVEEEVSVIYMICFDSSLHPEPVTDKEINDAAASLNRGKAPDAYGVTAEHIYYGGREVKNCVKTLINTILFNKQVPSAMKLGILNPIFKNKGNSNKSQNYRGITITPVLTRLLETILKFRIKSTLADHQNPLQRGFTENSSPMNCALLVEEFYRNNVDLNKPTYIAFMDVKSAFDVVVHPNLMRKLYNQGVDGINWLVINSLHQESVTAVKW